MDWKRNLCNILPVSRISAVCQPPHYGANVTDRQINIQIRSFLRFYRRFFIKTDKVWTLTFLFNKEYNGFKEMDLMIENPDEVIYQVIANLMYGQTYKSGYSTTREFVPHIMNAKDSAGTTYYFMLKKTTFPYYILE